MNKNVDKSIHFKVSSNEEKTIQLTKSGNYVVDLLGEGAMAKVIGVFNVANKEKLNINLLVHHQSKKTSAITNIKVVVDDEAEVNITGKIKVDENCGGTDSFLREKVLSLSPHAKVETVPDLEILTDDVKCSHAAAISNLDREQLFYLMSRGIKLKAAKKLIIESFLTTD